MSFNQILHNLFIFVFNGFSDISLFFLSFLLKLLHPPASLCNTFFKSTKEVLSIFWQLLFNSRKCKSCLNVSKCVIYIFCGFKFCCNYFLLFVIQKLIRVTHNIQSYFLNLRKEIGSFVLRVQWSILLQELFNLMNIDEQYWMVFEVQCMANLYDGKRR